MQNQMKAAIVVGANGGIGSAVLSRFLEDQDLDIVIAISRDIGDGNDKIWWFSSDYSETSIRKIISQLTQHDLLIRYIVIATGILHDEVKGITPEKRLASVDLNALEQIFSVNAFGPILWLKEFSSLLHKNRQTNIAVLSARVGSISDNKLGGWYSYRASKAALNMLLKSVSVEYRIRFPRVKLTAFHPGTTNTHLSKPFQKNISKDKLFEPEFVAEQLYTLLLDSPPDGELSFKDWQHKDIEW